eukprot:9288984-Lingulodinium_polyedra.AAC.1
MQCRCCLRAAWVLLGRCCGTAWELLGHCLGAAQMLRGNCLGAAWVVVLGRCLSACCLSGCYLDAGRMLFAC